ncbi:MAG: hypothetical protein ACRERC_15605 [Candidatus Binatia bacterium]
MRLTTCAGTALVALLLAASAGAQLLPVQHREPEPGAAALAAVGNVVYMPVRLAVFAVGGALGGLTGWLTAGNEHAAHDIWGLFDGQGYLQPAMLAGRETLDVGSLEFQMHVTD